jgi:hypothetical protein
MLGVSKRQKNNGTFKFDDYEPMKLNLCNNVLLGIYLYISISA